MNGIRLDRAMRSLHATGIVLSFLMVLIASPRLALAGSDQWIEQVVTTSPTLSIDDVSVTEGNGGTVDAVFNVRLSETTNTNVTVEFDTADNSATVDNGDYVANSGTVTITAGSLTTSITVKVNGDLTNEPPEKFLVNLSNPVGAKIDDGEANGNILNDDSAPTISIDDVSALEGDTGKTAFVFTVSLSHPTSLPVTVDYITKDGTAQGGGSSGPDDYQSASGTVTIPAKMLTATITIQVNGDHMPEAHETFFVNLSSGGQGQGLIRNDDGGPSGVGDELVADFALGKVMPTPSRDVARFEFALPRESRIRLTVLDLLGREVAVLAEGSYRAGRHQGLWNGRIGDQAAPAGVYFLRYDTPERNFVRRIVLAR